MSNENMSQPVDFESLMGLEESVRERIANASTDEERAALKADIIALYRGAEAGIKSYEALRVTARKFAEEWKERASTASAPLRVDHLGASTYVEKGWALLSAESYAESAAALRRALELAPRNREATALLAWAIAQLDQLDDAERLLGALLDGAGDSPLPLTVSGFVALRRGNAQHAMELLHRAIACASHDRRALLYAHLYLGMVFNELGMHDAAIEYLQRALTLGPNLLQAAFELGHTLWKCKRYDDAKHAWRAGAQANKFSAWGKRCADAMVQIEAGTEPAHAR